MTKKLGLFGLCSAVATVLGLSAIQQPANAALLVESFKSETHLGGGLSQADALIAGTGLVSSSSGLYDTINFSDSADYYSQGLFGGDTPFPNLAAGSDSFAVRVTGLINVLTAGDYSFGINSDDGFRLKVNGNNVLQADGYFVTTTFWASPLNLAAGSHAIEIVYFEGWGGASLEFFTQQADGSLRLVGDTANGGLGTAATPTAVPTPALLPGLLGLGLGVLRKRKAAQAEEVTQ